MDQSAINKIIMDNAAEEPDKKIEKLEKEIMILKGSIKKLIVDIREQMNNSENPFLNIQQLQMPAQAPVIKEDPISLDIPENPEMDEGEGAGGEKAKTQKPAKGGKPKSSGPAEGSGEIDGDDGTSRPGDEDGDSWSDEADERVGQPRGTDQARPRPGGQLQGYTKRDLEVINEFEEQKRMLDMLKSKTSAVGPATLTGSRRIDPYTINQIMDWTRMMLRKNGSERLMNLLEMYVSTGYISDETKAIIQRMSKLMESEPTRPPKRLDIKECVSDLYTLYVILNPGDKDLDSRMLNVLLNPDERY